jgi:dTDP-glucose pyrophosphorylase
MKYTLTTTENTRFEDAVKALDQGGIGFLALIDEQGLLLGILTDGDIRRAILNRKTDLREIMNRNPKTADYHLPQRQVVHLLKEIRCKHMPLVDANNHYKGIVALDDLEFNGKPNQVVIMAGGFGTRLGELTKEVPKPMLRVGKKSMLENLIDVFCDHGFNRFNISVYHKADVIKEYFGNGQAFGFEIKYLEEDKPLGTAGCLSLMSERPTEPFFVINGDILTTVNFEDLLDFHRQSAADGTMCVKKYDFQIPYGVVETSGRNIISLAEKPMRSCYVNSGIYVLEPEMIDLVPHNDFSTMPSLFEKMIKQKKKTISYELVDYWIDIGMPKDLAQARNDLTTI